LPERLGTKSKNSLMTVGENLNAKPACDTVKVHSSHGSRPERKSAEDLRTL